VNVNVITTGGTIAKTYDEAQGALRNDRPIIESILAGLRLPDLNIVYQHILSKDSLDLTDADRRLIVDTVRQTARHVDAIVIAHGTDTLEVTGELLVHQLSDVAIPIILTGAMRPYEFRNSDAAQNITEALLACRLLTGGVYAVMHNRILAFPGVVKDRQARSFVKRS